MQRRAAVLGSPIAHSLSPVLHRAAYAELALPWSYEAFDVAEAALPAFVAGLGPEWAGLSLTMPLKRVVLPLLDWVSPGARAVGAANTVVLGSKRRLGANTDVPGMVAALAERGIPRLRTATVLGGGATAASTLAALRRLDVLTPAIVVRRPEATAELLEVADRLGQTPRVVPWEQAGAELAADLVVQTAPAGAADGMAGGLPPRPGVLFDVIYSPWPTALAAAWQSSGGQVLGGLDLLVHQAVLQVRLMTGSGVPASRLASCMRAALAAHPGVGSGAARGGR